MAELFQQLNNFILCYYQINSGLLFFMNIKMHRYFLKSGLALITLGFLLVGALTAKATEYGGLGGRPARPIPGNSRSESIFIHDIIPGQSLEDAVKVINNSAETKTLVVYAADSIVSSGGAFACKQLIEEKKDAGAWITMSKQEVTLASLTFEEIPFTIQAPFNADVGEHNACILIQEKKLPPTGEQQNGIILSFRTGIRVALTVPGEIIRKLEIVNFSVVKKNQNSYILKSSLKNVGNVSIDADVKVRVASFLGPELPLLGGQYPILRGEITDLNFELPRPYWGGWYKAGFTASYDASQNAAIGMNSGAPLTLLKSQEVWFFVWPAPQALAIFGGGILIILILLIWIIWKLFRRHKIKKTWREYTCEKGTDIKKIADSFKCSWKLLAKVNKIKAPYIIAAGTKIKAPSKSVVKISPDKKGVKATKTTDKTKVSK